MFWIRGMLNTPTVQLWRPEMFHSSNKCLWAVSQLHVIIRLSFLANATGFPSYLLCSNRSRILFFDSQSRIFVKTPNTYILLGDIMKQTMLLLMPRCWWHRDICSTSVSFRFSRFAMNSIPSFETSASPVDVIRASTWLVKEWAAPTCAWHTNERIISMTEHRWLCISLHCIFSLRIIMHLKLDQGIC